MSQAALKSAPYLQGVSSRDADKFVIRLPEGMRERIAQVARTNHRSMNSEIITRLETSIAEETGAAPVDPGSVTANERRLLEAFRLLGRDKQKALLLLCSMGEQSSNDEITA